MNKELNLKFGASVVFVLGMAVVALAEAGTLDQSFGTGGQVLTSPLAPIMPDVAIQPDGKIVTVGGGFIGRYNSNGSLDTSFGGSGQISSNGTQVETQSDGKILIAGTTLSRYLSDGTLDPSFGSGGQVDNGSYNTNELLLQSDGKILWISQVYDYTDPQYGIQTKPQLARYLSNGTLDTSFAQNGILDRPNGKALALQSNGKILLGGTGFTVTRYTSAGTLDSSFGNGGTAIVSFPAAPWPCLPGGGSLVDVLVQTDNKIILAGNSTQCNQKNLTFPVFSTARLQSEGAVDNSYGTNGISSTSNNQETGRSVYGAAMQPDGKAIVVGEIYDYTDPHSYGGHYEFAITRFDTSGLIDQNFSGTTRVGDSAGAFAVAVQADGKAVSVGTAVVTGTTYQALVRYQP